ncbi:hypothetical protein ACIRPH_20190 [Nocardiopsis sp. NPDC101807]|uniref:hypothetical protein n=1 Tax=Nocardiopsis sp. NPDC101807 TaxID=3364339 RepID=UPI0037F86DDD
METGTVVIIVIAAVAVIAVGVALAARSSILPAQRTARLKKRFGAEYYRAVEAHGGRAAAERELSERLDRRKGMRLRRLTDREREAHAGTWAAVQQEFVDDPVSAVRSARGLVEGIMSDVGYADRAPAEDRGFEQRAGDLSVDHPAAVAEFHRVRGAVRPAGADRVGTEGLREELVAYRGLVEALLGGLPESPGTTPTAAPGRTVTGPARSGTDTEVDR